MADKKFEEEKFMKTIVNLKDTQESIQGVSGWCITNRKFAYKIARCWLKVIKKVKIDQKLVLFYLVNDILQHSKKRDYVELLDKFRNLVKEAMPHLKDEKIVPKVNRCLAIWEERGVFDSDFIQELAGLIDLTPTFKEDQEIVENFQPQQLCTQIKIMKALEDDTDYKLKTLKENDLDGQDIEEMKLKLKDKHCGDEFVNEFEDGTKKMEHYIKAMEREITKRRQVIELLGQGKKYYDSLLGEAEIVATAYSNFGNRVKKLKVKLNEKLPELTSSRPDGSVVSESPVPSPDYDAPSPGGDDEMELMLPGEETLKNTPPIVPYNPDINREGTDNRAHDLDRRLSNMGNFTPKVDSGNFDFLAASVSESKKPTVPQSVGAQNENLSISEFLTKIAHGEKLDVSSFIGGKSASSGEVLPGLGEEKEENKWVKSDWERSESWSEVPPVSGGRPPLEPSGGRREMEPWEEPVPEWLQVQAEEEEEVENLALERLRQAAKKSKPESSNLISLTGSPAVDEVGERRAGVARGSCDMDMDMSLSDEEEGEIKDEWRRSPVNGAYNSGSDGGGFRRGSGRYKSEGGSYKGRGSYSTNDGTFGGEEEAFAGDRGFKRAHSIADNDIRGRNVSSPGPPPDIFNPQRPPQYDMGTVHNSNNGHHDNMGHHDNITHGGQNNMQVYDAPPPPFESARNNFEPPKPPPYRDPPRPPSFDREPPPFDGLPPQPPVPMFDGMPEPPPRFQPPPTDYSEEGDRRIEDRGFDNRGFDNEPPYDNDRQGGDRGDMNKQMAGGPTGFPGFQGPMLNRGFDGPRPRFDGPHGFERFPGPSRGFNSPRGGGRGFGCDGPMRFPRGGFEGGHSWSGPGRGRGAPRGRHGPRW